MEIHITGNDLLILIVIVAIGLILAFFHEQKKRGILAAEYLVANQTRLASESELDLYLQIAEEIGTKEQYLKEPVKLRQKFGHKNIKLGHLLFIDQKLCGRIPEDVESPSFD